MRAHDRAILCTCALLALTLPGVAQAASFQPSSLVTGVTGLFALATLTTGAAALLLNRGLALLVRTETFVPEEGGDPVVAPNVRGWGVRQIATGVPLWAALITGDPSLFQIGLVTMLVRQALDIVANLLDGAYTSAAPYVVAAIPTAAALLEVL
jgi:hypothetical protein